MRELDLKNFRIKIREKEKIAAKQNDQLLRLEIAAGIIETNPGETIPSSTDDKTVQKYFKKFQNQCRATGTQVLGIKQYKRSLLKTLYHLLSMTSSSSIVSKKDFEVSESASKSDVDQKVTRALTLYYQFEGDIRSNISFG